MTTVISRSTALKSGLKHYFTGLPCKRGHVDRRLVSSFACMTCCRARALRLYRSQDSAQRQARSEYERRRWQDAEVKEKARQYRHKYQQEPDWLERRRAVNNEWKKKNREKLARKSREWYAANADYANERQKAYVATRPIEVRRLLGRKSANKRRAIKKQVFVEVVDPRVVFDRHEGICGICKAHVRDDPWEIDHVIPISKGGAHSYQNVQLAHRRCNRAKGAKLAEAS